MYSNRVYRVVQWTTGNVGKRSVQVVVTNPALELVGCYAWSPDKVGRDVGELCGIGSVGVTATNNVEALLALKPDCVVYNPMWTNTDELVAILSAGINVVTTAAFITGHHLGQEDRRRLVEACDAGGATIFGSGVNPGFAELFAILSATICDRVDKVTVTESADTTFYDSPATEIPVGFGTPIDHPDLQAMTAAGTGVFGDGVRLVADALGVELDDVRVKLSTRRPPKTSIWDPGRLRPDALLASTRGGQVLRAAAPSSSCGCGGGKGNRSSLIGHSMMAMSSTSMDAPQSVRRCSSCRLQTSKPRRWQTSWCSE